MISSDGVLSFKFSPDYEMQWGGTPTTQHLQVVVVASDEPLGAANRVMGYKKVTVMVTDVDEPGMVTLSPSSPRLVWQTDGYPD